jgi:A/G-specific adenine glycosylase
MLLPHLPLVNHSLSSMPMSNGYLHRYYALKERDEKKLWEYAYTLFDPAHPFEYNQAMMDLGASLCLPKKPLCHLCPFETTCQGKTNPLSYPEPKK